MNQSKSCPTCTGIMWGEISCRSCRFAKKREVFIPIGPSIAYVPLTKGQWALVAADDAAHLGLFNWQAHWAKATASFYALRKCGRRHIPMHAELLTVPDGMMHDHENGNSLDNRRCNLRAATPQQNNRNRRMQRNNTSGFRGVSWCERKRKWAAQIRVNGKGQFLGYFVDKSTAAQAYRDAALSLHGDFARRDTLIRPIFFTDLPLELLLTEQDIETLPEVEQE